MNTLAHINGNLRFVSVGILLAFKSLKVPRAVSSIIDNPGFPLLTAPGRPLPLANRHIHPPLVNMSQYVANDSASQRSLVEYRAEPQKSSLVSFSSSVGRSRTRLVGFQFLIVAHVVA